MPEFKASSRYQINDPADPTRWTDLTVPADDDEASFEVERVGERTKVYRVLVPQGRHDFGAEFPLFTRERSDMDSSWSAGGELPRGEVGIVHKVGVAIASVVCDTPTRNRDIEKVLYNAHLCVEVNEDPILSGSLETLPIGFGVHHESQPANGLAAMDSTPDRYPFLYTNEDMKFAGKLSFPHCQWLREAMSESTGAGEGGADAPATDEDEDGEERETERDCGDETSSPTHSNRCVTLESDVLVTFYMHGVFGRVREPNG